MPKTKFHQRHADKHGIRASSGLRDERAEDQQLRLREVQESREDISDSARGDDAWTLHPAHTHLVLLCIFSPCRELRTETYSLAGMGDGVGEEEAHPMPPTHLARTSISSSAASGHFMYVSDTTTTTTSAWLKASARSTRQCGEPSTPSLLSIQSRSERWSHKGKGGETDLGLAAEMVHGGRWSLHARDAGDAFWDVDDAVADGLVPDVLYMCHSSC